MADICQYL